MRTRADVTPTTEVGRNLLRHLNESPVYRGNAKALSLDADLGETAVRDILSGRSRRPTRETLVALATKLGIPVEALEASSRVGLAEEITPFAPVVRRSQPIDRDLIPIRTAGRGGGEQEMYQEDPIGYTPRPASLSGVNGGYAIYMVGDSMEPRYEQGWLLHINPFRPPARGRDVVVYKTNDAVLIKRFIRKSPTETILEQLNPATEIKVPNSEIRELHLIVGSDQEGG